jgi:hypothetical protein
VQLPNNWNQLQTNRRYRSKREEQCVHVDVLVDDDDERGRQRVWNIPTTLLPTLLHDLGDCWSGVNLNGSFMLLVATKIQAVVPLTE